MKKSIIVTIVIIIVTLMVFTACQAEANQQIESKPERIDETPTAAPTTAPTPTEAPTPIPTPTAIPASNDSMTVGDFEFRISTVQINNTINVLGPISNYKGSLTMNADGLVPMDAAPGKILLMVFLILQNGDYQRLLDSDLKIIEGDSTKSAVAILTQTQKNLVIWVYDVNPDSMSFSLVFPDDVVIDLTPVLP